MGISNKLKILFRGDIALRHLPLEILRRRRAAARLRAERASLDALNETPARLLPEFRKLSGEGLLEHFRSRKNPRTWLPEAAASDDIVRRADAIADERRWELMGFGSMTFDRENVWRRDPLGMRDWGLEHHPEVVVAPGDADIRVLWELNRFTHAPLLAIAYLRQPDEKYAETYFSHLEEWTAQNPYARGANWVCAMEAALRAAHLLAAFDIFRHSASLTEDRLRMLLRLFDQHGRFIVDNSEFSYIATSNHYLSDVVGLFWLGTMLPELQHAREWRQFGIREMLREMDKQVLPDGVDFEASTGYHKFVTEMFDASLRLAGLNGIDVPPRYVGTLRKMHDHLAGITRPDGGMPLIGDCDGSTFLPGSMVPAGGESANWPNGGMSVLRNDDLYLLLNASDCGVNGRGSHGHNDALSIEVSAHGVPFIVDPGSYAYNLDLDARHTFRSTAYHSTIAIDGEEQSSIDRDLPFVIGNEASPCLLEWTLTETTGRVSAEHYGYQRLGEAVTHRRTVEFDRLAGCWSISDSVAGRGEHRLQVVFHLAPGVVTTFIDNAADLACKDKHLILSYRGLKKPRVIDSFFSPAYGKKVPSTRLIFDVEADLPFETVFGLVPATKDNFDERLEMAMRLADNK